VATHARRPLGALGPLAKDSRSHIQSSNRLFITNLLAMTLFGLIIAFCSRRIVLGASVDLSADRA
jgi:hypothetical protein